MFDIGWTEMAVIAAVALLIIGPKDLPKVMRTVGQWVRKLRLLAGEFQRNIDDMVRDTELGEVKKQVESIGNTNLQRQMEEAVDPGGEIEKSLREDPSRPADEAAAEPQEHEFDQFDWEEHEAEVTPAATPGETAEPAEPADAKQVKP